MLTDKELLAWNRRGCIPGPAEEEETFLARVALLSKHTPRENALPASDWSEAYALTERLFDIRPDWLVAYYDNKGLPFWQGAATWIADGMFPLLQLKTAFRKGHYLKIYHRKELLAHESVHAARMAFKEPKFEEILAYQTSPSPFRRLLGALFQNPWESTLLLLLFLLSFLGQVALAFDPALFPASLLALPWAALGIACLRLLYRQSLFRRCRAHSAPLLKQPDLALAFLFRLTDREITLFAKSPQALIRAYISAQTSLRWRTLRLAYLSFTK